MENANQPLEFRYNQFSAKELPWPFFTGLGTYVEYALSVPNFKRIFDAELKKRNAQYEEIKNLENAAIEEMKRAKAKLLQIIKKRKVDVDSFSQDLSFIPLPSDGKKRNIIELLESFERGEVSISGFFSDNLERYLFDIAANILKLGYKDDLKEFLVSNKEYEAFSRRINGNEVWVSYNQNGNFIFSESWAKRFEQVSKVDAARQIESWGAFEAIMKFWKARIEVAKNSSFDQVFKSYMTDTGYYFAKEAVDVVYIVEDLKALMKNHDSTGHGVKFLRLEDFRNYAAVVHGCLLRAVEKDVSPEKPSQINLDLMREVIQKKRDSLWRGIVDDFMKETQAFVEEYRLDRQQRINVEQGVVDGKWWADEDRPIFDKETGNISLGNRICNVPLNATNQIVLCNGIFSSQFGSWIGETDVVDKFYKGSESSQSFYDAVRAVNKRLEDDFGIVGMLEYRASRARIRANIFVLEN